MSLKIKSKTKTQEPKHRRNSCLKVAPRGILNVHFLVCLTWNNFGFFWKFSYTHYFIYKFIEPTHSRENERLALISIFLFISHTRWCLCRALFFARVCQSASSVVHNVKNITVNVNPEFRVVLEVIRAFVASHSLNHSIHMHTHTHTQLVTTPTTIIV